MSEMTFTACDFCNPDRNIHGNSGRGYAVGSTESVVENLDWKAMSDGKVMCIECQEDRGIA